MKHFYAVFPHSEKCVPTGRGYVVRKSDDSGRAEDFHNYRNIANIGKVYHRMHAAERAAVKLNGVYQSSL